MLVHTSEILEILLFSFISGIIFDNFVKYKFNKWKRNTFDKPIKLEEPSLNDPN
jgi:hypothetical protein